MFETRNLEFKAEVTNTFLKTVSAFANYGSGDIVFGVEDNGNICGIADCEKACLDLENKINDSISPKPDYTLRSDNNNKTVTLHVEEGQDKPYLYKGKAYKRNDTSTVEVDRGELNRLTLIGTGQYYDQLPAQDNNLEFRCLEKALQEKLGIEKLTQDICKTLNLYYSQNRFNHAAELLADVNGFPGLDIAVFGRSNDIILDRMTYKNMSIIEQLREAVLIFQRYCVYEKIEGAERLTKEKIPAKAFREAVANALIHRTWDINANIRVAIYSDRVEIASPGGLPWGMSKEEYLRGYVSVLRNPVLANVFFRLKYVEIFGTGVRRILDAYKGKLAKPEFNITDNAVVVVLPNVDEQILLTADEQRVLQAFLANRVLNSSDIIAATAFNKAKVARLLKALLAKNKIVKLGIGRATKYNLR